MLQINLALIRTINWTHFSNGKASSIKMEYITEVKNVFLISLLSLYTRMNNNISEMEKNRQHFSFVHVVCLLNHGTTKILKRSTNEVKGQPYFIDWNIYNRWIRVKLFINIKNQSQNHFLVLCFFFLQLSYLYFYVYIS